MPATSTTPAPLEGRCLSRQDCRYRHITAAALIGQIKLTRIHVALLFLPGVRVKRIKRRSLYNVERSGFFVTEATQKSKLCSLFHTLMYLGMPQSSGACPALRRSANRKTRKASAFLQEMVEPDGIEPTTSCLQSRRSPS